MGKSKKKKAKKEEPPEASFVGGLWVPHPAPLPPLCRCSSQVVPRHSCWRWRIKPRLPQVVSSQVRRQERPHRPRCWRCCQSSRKCNLLKTISRSNSRCVCTTLVSAYWVLVLSAFYVFATPPRPRGDQPSFPPSFGRSRTKEDLVFFV